MLNARFEATESTTDDELHGSSVHLKNLAYSRAESLIKEGRVLLLDQADFEKKTQREFKENADIFLKHFNEFLSFFLKKVTKEELVRRLARRRANVAIKSSQRRLDGEPCKKHVRELSRTFSDTVEAEKFSGVYLEEYKKQFSKQTDIKKRKNDSTVTSMIESTPKKATKTHPPIPANLQSSEVMPNRPPIVFIHMFESMQNQALNGLTNRRLQLAPSAKDKLRKSI